MDLEPTETRRRLARDAKPMELGGGTTEIRELTAGSWLFERSGR